MSHGRRLFFGLRKNNGSWDQNFRRGERSEFSHPFRRQFLRGGCGRFLPSKALAPGF